MNFWNLSWNAFENPDYTRVITQKNDRGVYKYTYCCFADFPTELQINDMSALQYPHWKIVLLLEKTNNDGSIELIKLFPNGSKLANFVAAAADTYDYYFNI